MKNIVMKNFIRLFFAAVILSGCNHNPVNPDQNLTLTKPDTNKTDSTVFPLEAPDTIQCLEGDTVVEVIKGYVPEPGEAIVEIMDMPQGASYDAATGKFTYTPGFNVVDQAKNPTQLAVSMKITVSIRSSLIPSRRDTKVVNIIVTNKTQPVDIQVTPVQMGEEGKTFIQTVKIVSPDFPMGPFTLTALNAPAGTTITPVAGAVNEFNVQFFPAYTFTTKLDNWDSTLENYFHSVKIDYQVGQPTGPVFQKEAEWRIADVRQLPVITVPETITQGLDVNFTIRAEDMNGERVPKVTLLSAVPFGKVTIDSITSSRATNQSSFPATLMSIRWDQLRAEHLGTSTKLTFNVCVLGASIAQIYNLCTQKDVVVNLTGEVHKAPLIDRSQWQVGDLKFVQEEQRFSHALPIIDAEDKKLPVKVSIQHTSNADIQWKNDRLIITPKEEGILQFTVNAESVFGVKTSENFVIDVLSKTWNKHLVLTGDQPQKESTMILDLLSNGDLTSTRYRITGRNLALRDSVVITTEAIASQKLNDLSLMHLLTPGFTLMVSSPLLDQLTSKLKDVLDLFGIKIKGRFSDLSKDDLSAFTLSVDQHSGLATPNIPVGLQGTLTKESKSPLIFDLSKMSGYCAKLFNLQKPAMSLPVGVKCESSISNKHFVFLGFEIADILSAPEDAPLMKEWMQTLVKGTVKGK